MKKLLLFLFGLTLFQALPMDAQSLEPVYRNQITLTIGGQKGYFKDENFSPLNYRSGGLRFGLGYDRITTTGQLISAELGVNLTTLTANVPEPRKPDRFLIDLSLGYFKALPGETEDRQFHLGLKYRTYADITLYEGSEALSFFALHGVEVAGRGSWRTGTKSRLHSAVSLPVFGLLVRPPYTGWDKFISNNSDDIAAILTRGKWTSLNDFTALRVQLGWDYQASDHWHFGARYDLGYYTTQWQDPVRILNNQFSLSATRKY